MNTDRFMEAYDAYADAIFRYLYYKVYDRERAKDLVQETFTKTWEYLSQGKHIDNLRAFLYRVARNLVIDHSRKKTALSLDALAEQGLDPGKDERPELTISIDSKNALAVIKLMDEKYRDVLIMRYVNGFSPKEIAKEIGESENVISVRIHRALKHMRKLLEPDPNDYV